MNLSKCMVAHIFENFSIFCEINYLLYFLIQKLYSGSPPNIQNGLNAPISRKSHVTSRNQNMFEKPKSNRNFRSISFEMLHNIGSQMNAGSALKHLLLLFRKSVYLAKCVYFYIL